MRIRIPVSRIARVEPRHPIGIPVVVESACHKVVKELMCNPNWNETAYDLDLIKQKVKKQDPITREDEMAEALKAIYYRWKKRIGGPALKAFRDEYLKNPTQ